jgi:hypothetical protein
MRDSLLLLEPCSEGMTDKVGLVPEILVDVVDEVLIVEVLNEVALEVLVL